MAQLLKRIVVAQRPNVVISDLGQGVFLKKNEPVDLLNRVINNQIVVRFTLEDLCKSRSLDSALKTGAVKLYDEEYKELGSISGGEGERSTNLATIKDVNSGGVRLTVDYNDSSTSAESPLNLVGATWTDIPNNGAGPYTNVNHLPDHFGSLIDGDTGYIDLSSLSVGDTVLIRNDFRIIPAINGSYVQFRIGFGSGLGIFYLTQQVGSLSNGAGIEYPIELLNSFYIGSTDILNNYARCQIICSDQAEFINSGVAITVLGHSQ